MTDSKLDQDHLDSAHIDWLVKHRAENQGKSAKLYKIMKEYKFEIMKIKDLSSQSETLVSISFSLWRSAFLSDKTKYNEAVYDSAINFLNEILINNAIAYPQERRSKDWTFNYYANNALLRLRDLAKVWPESQILSCLAIRVRESPKEKWERLQGAFAAGVDYLESRAMAERAKGQ